MMTLTPVDDDELCVGVWNSTLSCIPPCPSPQKDWLVTSTAALQAPRAVERTLVTCASWTREFSEVVPWCSG